MIVILMGVSGSGKSTLGKKLADKCGWIFLEGDHFHSKTNREKMKAGTPLTDDDRQPWLRAIAGEIKRLAGERADGVVACSALKEKYRELLSKEAPVRWIYLKGSRELIQRRMAGRGAHFMNPRLLESQFAALEEPKGAIVIDINQDSDTLVDEIMRQLSQEA